MNLSVADANQDWKSLMLTTLIKYFLDIPLWLYIGIRNAAN